MTDNELEHPDLWQIGLAQLREDSKYLKLGVRIRLELESVRAQKEIDEAIVIMNNTSGIVEGLMASTQIGIDNINNAFTQLQTERLSIRSEADDVRSRLDIVRRKEEDLVLKQKEFEDEQKKPNFGIIQKVYVGGAFLAGTILAWIGL